MAAKSILHFTAIPANTPAMSNQFAISDMNLIRTSRISSSV